MKREERAIYITRSSAERGPIRAIVIYRTALKNFWSGRKSFTRTNVSVVSLVTILDNVVGPPVIEEGSRLGCHGSTIPLNTVYETAPTNNVVYATYHRTRNTIKLFRNESPSRRWKTRRRDKRVSPGSAARQNKALARTRKASDPFSELFGALPELDTVHNTADDIFCARNGTTRDHPGRQDLRFISRRVVCTPRVTYRPQQTTLRHTHGNLCAENVARNKETPLSPRIFSFAPLFPVSRVQVLLLTLVCFALLPNFHRECVERLAENVHFFRALTPCQREEGRGATNLAQSRSTFCSDASRRQLFTAECRSGRARRTELLAERSARADIPLATQLFARDRGAPYSVQTWRMRRVR
ncbi:uncharacterized protein LOC143147446 [Ptiloglossa arizonensis]|uniref:uncharacterized protein LOC143147446 n=1 Tax=Ptiloglossa arizonensis TaxID=3350558 RepID=UPI003F9F8D1C